MAVGGSSDMAKPQPMAQPLLKDVAGQPNVFSAMSPPSKSELKSWWKRFGRKTDTDDEHGKTTPTAPIGVPPLTWSAAIPPPGIFGVPLAESIRYANVAISFTDGVTGESQLYGYVPIVVAKCGVYLKEKGMASRSSAVDASTDGR